MAAPSAGLGVERRVIDLMHDFEKFVRLQPVLFHQAAHGGAVAAVIILLQPERLFVTDFEEIDDVIADADVDLLPQIEVMRIKRVVEVEHPGVDVRQSRGRSRVTRGVARSPGRASTLP